MKGDSSSIVTKKLNKLKDFVTTKKKKAFEATAGKFTSNGSVNGLRNATSDAELQNKVGGELEQQQPRLTVSLWEDLKVLSNNYQGQWNCLVVFFVGFQWQREFCKSVKI